MGPAETSQLLPTILDMMNRNVTLKMLLDTGLLGRFERLMLKFNQDTTDMMQDSSSDASSGSETRSRRGSDLSFSEEEDELPERFSRSKRRRPRARSTDKYPSLSLSGCDSQEF